MVAIGGAVVCHLLLARPPLEGAVWLRVLAAGFEAAVVGGLADWFAVTALFRHPLGIPIPHTAIIPRRRDKIIEGIVTMVQDEWLSPRVIGTRLSRFSPSELLLDWLRDPTHVQRLGAPLRDLLRALARTLREPEVIDFIARTVRRELGQLPVDESAGRVLARAAQSESAAAAFRSASLSLANLAIKPETAQRLQQWIDHSARQLYRDGRRLVPLLLRRKAVQRRIVDAVCEYGASELLRAVEEPDHRLRVVVFGSVERFAERLACGDPEAIARIEQLRRTVIESLEAGPLVQSLVWQLQEQVEHDLREADSALSELIDRKLRMGILDLLADPERRSTFDQWVRTTADDLLRRHHDQIGLTVRENLEALETQALVRQIEERVGADLQFIRLNGALVGGLIGVLLALLHRLI